MRSVTLLSAGLAFAFAAAAAPPETAVTATGYGMTESEALGDALARAASQINGGAASISTGVTDTSLQVHALDGAGRAAAADAQIRQGRSADFSGGGAIAGYQVLSTTPQGKGYAVTVKAEVAQYAAPSLNPGARRIALMPLTDDGSRVAIRGASVDAADLAADLYPALEAELLAGGGFQLLDRAQLNQSLGELSLIGSPLAAPVEKAKLQRLSGADYVVMPTLQARSDQPAVNRATGERSSRAYDVRLTLRAVVPATSEVVWSGTVEVDPAQVQSRRELAQTLARSAVSQLGPALRGGVAVVTGAVNEPPLPPRAETGVKLPFDR